MEHSVCFIGHRKINDTPELRERLRGILLDLIENGTVNFIFGDHSAFDDLCYELVTELKKKTPRNQADQLPQGLRGYKRLHDAVFDCRI